MNSWYGTIVYCEDDHFVVLCVHVVTCSYSGTCVNGHLSLVTIVVTLM